MSSPRYGGLRERLRRRSILLGLDCGSRLRLRYPHLDLRWGQWSLDESKNGRSLRSARPLGHLCGRPKLAGALLALAEASRDLDSLYVPRPFQSHRGEVT